MTSVRQRVVLVSAVVVAAVAGALIFEALLSLDEATPFGHTRYGHAAGWVGFAVTLLVFVYPLRKRISPARRWPRGWFRVPWWRSMCWE